MRYHEAVEDLLRRSLEAVWQHGPCCAYVFDEAATVAAQLEGGDVEGLVGRLYQALTTGCGELQQLAEDVEGALQQLGEAEAERRIERVETLGPAEPEEDLHDDQ